MVELFIISVGTSVNGVLNEIFSLLEQNLDVLFLLHLSISLYLSKILKLSVTPICNPTKLFVFLLDTSM